ncbi:MAG: hypothetical protein GW808_02095 [Sphingomonadales bacterium]|nr:hypothetical protein [Sphingomonadales bacterium]NCO47918.1 hypothetical protein [Sphingomonadales bacterium]NCO99197.1 hypothetical protein [Sphingomonadales bacterium]NCP27602.1 hypothetical protein [Sphingomonadales bacterium]NCP42240.1 hypothetical protein [Sphingomonadales bacterium]
MPVYVITYEHPNEAGWHEHLGPHIDWLRAQLSDGSLLASGPLTDASQKEALLIINAPDRTVLDTLIRKDPYATEGLIENMVVREWDPIFGAFNEHSSMPG